MYQRYEWTRKWGDGMVDRPMTPEEVDWLTDESMRTPTYAALSFAIDAIYADYRPEAILLDKNHVPVINIVSQAVAATAKAWLNKNAPHSEIQVLGKHMMFWEYPEKFNQMLDEFLSRRFVTIQRIPLT